MIRFLQTPGPIKKILLGGLLTLICLLMVITLVPGFVSSDFLSKGSSKKGVVAEIGDQEVSSDEVRRAAKQMIQQQYPKAGAQASFLLPFVSGQAAQQLIIQRALLVEADHMGLRVTDQEVADDLQKGIYAPTFFPGGKFVGQEAYESLLAQADLTPTRFEEGVKREILVDKLRGLVVGSATVTDAEIRQEFDNKNTKVKFDYAVLRRDDILKGLHPSDAELKAYYERNKAAYTNSIPEKRKLQYVVLDAAKIEAATSITRPELQSYYDQNRDQYRVQERVNVRHILIKAPPAGTDGKVDQKAVDEARKKAEDVLKQVKAGGKFDELAKKYSEDPGSANKGGSLGWIVKGQTVPEFEKASFSMPKGSTSDLVQSSFGFHIIHVDDKEEAHMKTLDEVKDQIEPVLRKQKAAQIADAQAASLLSQARNLGMEKAAAAGNLHLVTTDFVGQSDSLVGIGNDSQFMNAVFAKAPNSPPDEARTPTGSAVYQVLEVKPPATPSFEEARNRIENEFKNERASALLTQKTQELSDRAKASHDLKKVAKELGAQVKTSDLVLPDAQVPDLGSMAGAAASAFRMKPGEISGPIDTGTVGAVLSIVDRQGPSEQDFAEKKDEIRASLLKTKQQDIFELFATGLRDRLEKEKKIRINQEEMKLLTKSRTGEEGE